MNTWKVPVPDSRAQETGFSWKATLAWGLLGCSSWRWRHSGSKESRDAERIAEVGPCTSPHTALRGPEQQAGKY